MTHTEVPELICYRTDWREYLTVPCRLPYYTYTNTTIPTCPVCEGTRFVGSREKVPCPHCG